jgi:hypothetical protein
MTRDTVATEQPANRLTSANVAVLMPVILLPRGRLSTSFFIPVPQIVESQNIAVRYHLILFFGLFRASVHSLALRCG